MEVDHVIFKKGSLTSNSWTAFYIFVLVTDYAVENVSMYVLDSKVFVNAIESYLQYVLNPSLALQLEVISVASLCEEPGSKSCFALKLEIIAQFSKHSPRYDNFWTPSM